MRSDIQSNLKRFIDYLNEQELPLKTTWAALALELNLSERTLHRYRKIVSELTDVVFIRSQNKIIVSELTLMSSELTVNKLGTDTYDSGTDTSEAPIRNTPLYSGVVGCTTGVLSTTGVLNKCTTNVLTEGEKTEMSKNKEQAEIFPKDEELDLDNYPLASVLAKEAVEFPRHKQAVNAAVVWYWAVHRFRKYGYDTSFSAKTFAQAAIKYSKNIIPHLGKSWEEHKKYIDWYLDQIRDDFIAKNCKFNFNYFTSPHCLNKFFDAGVDIPHKKGYVETAEERKAIKYTII